MATYIGLHYFADTVAVLCTAGTVDLCGDGTTAQFCVDSLSLVLLVLISVYTRIYHCPSELHGSSVSRPGSQFALYVSISNISNAIILWLCIAFAFDTSSCLGTNPARRGRRRPIFSGGGYSFHRFFCHHRRCPLPKRRFHCALTRPSPASVLFSSLGPEGTVEAKQR